MLDDNIKPAFFLSYSTTKAIRPESVKHFVDVVEEVVRTHFNGSIIDPMTSQKSVSIRGDVIESLKECDFVIAETTSAAPNVYYEIGFADALGKPAILFLDADRDKNDSPQSNDGMREIRKRVFGSSHPSDLGDIRYIPYNLPDNPREEELDKLRQVIRTAIDGALAHRLRSNMMAPARSIQRTFLSSQNVLHYHATQPSKLWLINGISLYVDEYYRQLSNTRMQVDESLYESMLKVMPSPMRASALAIADMTDDFEPFMLTTHDLESVKVRARIFVFDADSAFETGFERLVSNIWRHAQKYQCYMIDRDFALDVLGSSGVQAKTNCQGANLMSTGQSAVWYSPRPNGVREVGNDLLTIDSDMGLVHSVETLFHSIVEKSVNISALAKDTKAQSGLQRAKAVKSEWQRIHEIGLWESDWNGRTNRGDRYYRDYERHIRVWIPNYRKLIDQFLDQSVEAISEAAQGRQVRIIEVGPGTGELTEKLILRISKRSRRVSTDMVQSYTVVEDAPEMLERMYQRRLIERNGSSFSEGMYPPTGDGRIRVRPHNLCFLEGMEIDRAEQAPTIVLGSLVHHYIDILDNDKPDFGKFIEGLIERIPSVIQVVLAGLFFSDDMDAQIESWRKWMARDSGLDTEWVDRFFDGNPEMQRRFLVSKIRSDAEQKGFTARFTPVNPQIPFGVLRLKRKTATG